MKPNWNAGKRGNLRWPQCPKPPRHEASLEAWLVASDNKEIWNPEMTKQGRSSTLVTPAYHVNIESTFTTLVPEEVI